MTEIIRVDQYRVLLRYNTVDPVIKPVERTRSARELAMLVHAERSLRRLQMIFDILDLSEIGQERTTEACHTIDAALELLRNKLK